MHPACEWATSKPADTITGFIQDLRTNASQYQDKMRASSLNVTDSDAFYTDRRYYGQRTRHMNRNQGFRQPIRRSNLKCYVCKKLGCFSTKHTQDERDAARR